MESITSSLSMADHKKCFRKKLYNNHKMKPENFVSLECLYLCHIIFLVILSFARDFFGWKVDILLMPLVCDCKHLHLSFKQGYNVKYGSFPFFSFTSLICRIENVPFNHVDTLPRCADLYIFYRYGHQHNYGCTRELPGVALANSSNG